MMKLGFVSAILADQSLDEVVRFAAANGFACVEAMCWPVGQAERRYAGVTHVDVTNLNDAEAKRIRSLLASANVELSGLGYYPNPLCADEREAAVCIEHLKRVISAAPQLGLKIVNTFVGRDPARSLAENWKLFDRRWPAIIEHAEASKVSIGIENCPMYFTEDEWPGGKNLAVSPKIWREMFRRIPSKNFGLNYDPSHAVWQFMDSARHVREFADRLVHVHAKDVRVDRERLNQVGIMATPLEYHRPKLPGLGEVPWPEFFAALTDVGYQGPVCVEVEDRAYEGSLEARREALRQSGRFLKQFVG
jgi:sugar phosphate isomerase/epimerase